MSQSKYWCFTLNNPTFEYQELLDRFSVSDKIKYAIFQREQGLEGTTHFQGYCEFNNRCRLTTVKSIIDPRCHVEIRRGTGEQARSYCQKDESRVDGPWEFGVWDPVTKGQRTDLEAVKRAFDEGTVKNEKEFADTFFGVWAKYPRLLSAYKATKIEERDQQPMVRLFIGPPGTGKSRAVREEGGSIYWKTNGIWWDGYTPGQNVCFDDFYGGYPWSELLRICDRYPMQVQVKGSYLPFNSPEIYFTSNRLPREWYQELLSKNAIDIRAFERRCSEIWVFGRNGRRRARNLKEAQEFLWEEEQDVIVEIN